MQVKYLDLSCLTCVCYSQTIIEAQFVYIRCILYFFLENAGELRLIKLRRE